MKQHTGPLVALALAAVQVPAQAQTFTVIGLPDTQNYSEFYPAIYAQQTQWIAANIDVHDIRYVSHYGDVVNHGDRPIEWAVADAAMTTLDLVDVPYGVTAGNHDITPSGSAGSAYIPQYFRQYFGAQRFAGRTWFGGDSPSGMSSWQVFTAGGVDFLTLHLECDTALRELEWAQGVLNTNRDKVVLMTTHRYLQDAEDYTSGVPIVPSGRYPDIWYSYEGVYPPDGIRSEQLFDWFVRRNPNIALVQCGHFHEEYRQTSTNVRGKPVHEILADYQDDPNGGGGWLRIHRFDLANDRIEVESYSPFLNQYRTADESRFTLPFDADNYREFDPVVVLQEGVNGYAGTRDTWLNEASPNTSYGESPVRVSDDDVSNSIFTDDRGQALVRFDGLIGQPGRVPAGAVILSATLTLQLADDIDTPFFDPDFLVHQVLVPWSESSTWNSMSNGLQVGSELAPAFAVFPGDNNPNGDGMRRIDVRAVVQSWANGAPNYGFAILPEIISGNDDGIEIFTSESSNPLLRPAIEVVYRAPGAGLAFCAGDGSAGACPCGTLSAPGSGAGCANSLGVGGLLAASGIASLAGDTLVLAGEGMPNATVLYFQGTTRQNGGTGSPFGDGLRCAGGTVVRLAATTNVAGASRYPFGPNAPVSVRGSVGTPGVRTYQAWYRNAASFCTGDTFNLTNGVEIAWGL